MSTHLKKLLQLSKRWDQADSSYEETFFERQMQDVLQDVYRSSKPFAVEELLERFDSEQYNVAPFLFETALQLSEHKTIERDGQTLDCILMSLPVIVWPYNADQNIQPSAKVLEKVIDGLKQHIVTPGTEVILMPAPMCPLELADSLSQVRLWLDTLAQGLTDPQAPLPTPNRSQDLNVAHAETLHWVLVAAQPSDQPILKWMQGSAPVKKICLKAWINHMQPIYEQLYPGCQTQIFLPNILSQAQESMAITKKHMTVRTTIVWIESMLGIPRSEITATIMEVQNEWGNEFRIGYCLKDENIPFYGNIWPIDEALMPDVPDLTENLDDFMMLTADLNCLMETLDECDIDEVIYLETVEEAQFCPDCHTPFLPGLDDCLHHPRIPDEILNTPRQLH